jgi:hypothetical protein
MSMVYCSPSTVACTKGACRAGAAAPVGTSDAVVAVAAAKATPKSKKRGECFITAAV